MKKNLNENVLYLLKLNKVTFKKKSIIFVKKFMELNKKNIVNLLNEFN
jgi:hypothetical protein